MRSFPHFAAAIILAFALDAGQAQAAKLPGVKLIWPSTVARGRVAVRFMGTSTILLDDGATQILVDGFFTRPSVRSLFSVKPDPAIIGSAMEKAGIGNRLRAVLVAHSHYDHALDAPTVALRTGARLVGSASTAMIGRGAGLQDSRIDVVGHGQELDYGAFHVTVFRSVHSPNMLAAGEIQSPLTPPRPAGSYREGGSYSFLVSHHGFAMLIHPSANAPEGLYRNVRADVVFLGIGTLGNQTSQYQSVYWRRVVEATGARLVIPIHWDNFTRPLSDGLRLPLKGFDDVQKAVNRMKLEAYLWPREKLSSMLPFDAVDIEAAAAP